MPHINSLARSRLSRRANDRLMASPAAATCKRPAPDGDCSAAAAPANKRPCYWFSTIGDYELLEEVLGEGHSYGAVVKARDRHTGETVAVKRAPGCSAPGRLRAFLREAGCLAECRGHPSVVQIRDVAADEATGDLFLVTELVPGRSLRRELFTRGCFNEAEARASMRQLLAAAEKMHGGARAVVHGDIRPDNILVGLGGALKICGFGCATPATKPVLKPCTEEEEEEREGAMLYRSPEQLIARHFQGPAMDMWALGCVMAELLAGAPPFTAETEEDLLAEILDLHDVFLMMELEAFDEDLPLPELSLAGREVLAGLLSYDPDERLTATDALKHRWFTEEAETPAVAKAESPGFVPLFSAA